MINIQFKNLRYLKKKKPTAFFHEITVFQYNLEFHNFHSNRKIQSTDISFQFWVMYVQLTVNLYKYTKSETPPVS